MCENLGQASVEIHRMECKILNMKRILLEAEDEYNLLLTCCLIAWVYRLIRGRGELLVDKQTEFRNGKWLA